MSQTAQHIIDSLNRLERLQAQQFIDSMDHAQLMRRLALQQEAEHDAFMRVLIPILILLVFIGSFVGYYIFNKRYWERGIFPPMLSNRRSNHYEAIVNIAVSIMLCDKNSYRDKQQYLERFLGRKFPDIGGDARESVKSAIAVPLSVESVAYWLNKRMKVQREKEELLTFFFSLAAIDATIGRREQEILRLFSRKMNLDPKLFEQLFTDQRRKRAERIAGEQQQTRKVSRTDYRKEKAVAALGLKPDCNAADIKKAYRKLAMQYHPDRFQQHPEAARKEAEGRFLEIQQAYEYLAEA